MNDDSCQNCDRPFSASIEEHFDTEARFWLGDNAPRYCYSCAETLSDMQREER
jgi:hypothetical protein